MTDISVILAAHHEGALAGPTLRSLLDAVEQAESDGISVDVTVVLDDPNRATLDVFADATERGWSVLQVDVKDHGLARNYAAERVSGDIIAHLDADDLWSRNWLSAGYEMVRAEGDVIVHPEVDWFFGESANLFFHTDQLDPSFDPAFLRFSNYWDSLCMVPRHVMLDFPLAARDIPGGFAYDDWFWNIETVRAGIVHRVAAGTIHFKRRQKVSQNILAVTNKSLTRWSPLLTYEYARQAERV
ncbi:glycosyltransferase [Isoptericola jiangsuensis]|uniref:glycosyltransferase n=1 Tax=Isoptericola jiangsuensis TaxID=548579 RepID=UPI003AAC79E9